eukprot:NODE_229_length_2428_cov_62.633039_g176_i0.p1 GENE.NODE_229_length_2428_cov_62.633039_g176_i0~~NODE_229_length_2428_cov_62.633039_g176_i0.p1  ORF type:complete len:793 (-),score=248.94 NODE_229_length_2428_cov_62.633039_g176_i0:48-2147(-)
MRVAHTVSSEEHLARRTLQAGEAAARAGLLCSEMDVVVEPHIRERITKLEASARQLLVYTFSFTLNRYNLLNDQRLQRREIAGTEAKERKRMYDWFYMVGLHAEDAEHLRLLADQSFLELCRREDDERNDLVELYLLDGPRARVGAVEAMWRRRLADDLLVTFQDLATAMIQERAAIIAALNAQHVPLFTDDELPLLVAVSGCVSDEQVGRRRIESEHWEALSPFVGLELEGRKKAVLAQTMRELAEAEEMKKVQRQEHLRALGLIKNPHAQYRYRRNMPPEEAAVKVQRKWREHKVLTDSRRGVHRTWAMFPGPVHVPPGTQQYVPEGFGTELPPPPPDLPPEEAPPAASLWDVPRLLFRTKPEDDPPQKMAGLWLSAKKDPLGGGFYLKITNTKFSPTVRNMLLEGDLSTKMSRTAYVDFDFSECTNLQLVQTGFPIIDCWSSTQASVTLPPGGVCALKLIPIVLGEPVDWDGVKVVRGARKEVKEFPSGVKLITQNLSMFRGYDLYFENPLSQPLGYDFDFKSSKNLKVLPLTGQKVSVDGLEASFTTSPGKTEFFLALRSVTRGQPVKLGYTFHQALPGRRETLPCGVVIAAEPQRFGQGWKLVTENPASEMWRIQVDLRATANLGIVHAGEAGVNVNTEEKLVDVDLAPRTTRSLVFLRPIDGKAKSVLKYKMQAVEPGEEFEDLEAPRPPSQP